MIRELLWRAVANIVTRPNIRYALVQRAERTPYTDITSADGTDVYMRRWWLFNPYGKDANGDPTPARWTWLPSIRIHWILRADQDRDLHDHPWNARTIVLSGWYAEERPFDSPSPGWTSTVLKTRQSGYTGRLLFNQYHRIAAVSPGGVMTMFFTWRKRGTWGFLVDGKKVPWREYLGINP